MSVVAPMMICVLTGCASIGGGFTPPWKKAEAKIEGPKDSVTLTGRGIERQPIDPAIRNEFDAAQRLMQEKKHAEAERIYHKWSQADPSVLSFFSNIFDQSSQPDLGPGSTPGGGLSAGASASGKLRGKHPPAVYEEALFGEAEAQRLQMNYRDAVDTYTKLLIEFRHSQYTNRACQGLFEIAHHWLEPTRKQMIAYEEQVKGERWFVTPAIYVNFTKDMPLLDAEGHAVKILNTIRLHDLKGNMGKQALFYLGTINFFRKDYKEADFYFTQIYENYKDSPEAAKAIKQSIICKQLSTGGSVYDLRPVEESKKLIMTAQGAYPEFAKEQDWVWTQLISINVQQADRDYKIAEFYERTGHPGSAYFYYELVCRRYPGSDKANKAAERKIQLKSQAEREQIGQGGPPPAVQERREQPSLIPPRTLPSGLDR